VLRGMTCAAYRRRRQESDLEETRKNLWREEHRHELYPQTHPPESRRGFAEWRRTASHPDGRNLGWKHTRVKPESELRRYDILQNGICFVTVTKNPYSWLLSMHRRPYHRYYGEKPDFHTFLRSPWKTVGRDNYESVLRDPVELWNIKNKSYLRLKSLETANITSESVLADPKALIDRLSDSFSIPKSDNYFSNLDESTKEKSKNFDYYRDYYLNERWKDELSDESISIINSRLDRNLVDYFGYELLDS
jgi:hypothetical protein